MENNENVQKDFELKPHGQTFQKQLSKRKFKSDIKTGFSYGIGFIIALVIVQFTLALIGGVIA